MNNKENSLALLQLFAEGQGAGVNAEAAAQQSGVTAPDNGAQVLDAGVPDEAEDMDAAFEELIKGKFKAQYQTKVQDILRKRLKDAKQTADAGQPDSESGVPEVESHPNQPAAQVEDLMAVWNQQEQETRNLYPAFDMRAEIQNPLFVKLIMNDVDVRTAYEVLHRHEIVPAAMEYAARTVEASLAKRIAAGSARPDENGMGFQASAVVKGDVSKFSKRDIDDVARRVARGERITFG